MMLNLTECAGLLKERSKVIQKDDNLKGTVTGVNPEEFDPEEACRKLYEGMDCIGTSEEIIIEVVVSHNNKQRQIIKEKYETLYDKDLECELEGELSGDFCKVVLALMKEPEDYIFESIHEVLSKKTSAVSRLVPRSLRRKMGLGADEYAIMSLLGTRTNAEMHALKKFYKRKYGNDMEEDIANDLSGDFKFLVEGMMRCGRDESDALDPRKIMADVEALQDVSRGEKQKLNFMLIFLSRSYVHMRAVFDAFKEHRRSNGMDIEDHIRKEFSSSMKAAYLSMAKIFRSVQGFYADRLHEALKGAGTNDDSLIRIIVMRAEIDLKDIMDVYKEMYGSELIEDIASDTSGDYGVILEKLLTPAEVEIYD